MEKIVMGSAHCMRDIFYRDARHISIHLSQFETENNQVQLVQSMKFIIQLYTGIWGRSWWSEPKGLKDTCYPETWNQHDTDYEYLTLRAICICRNTGMKSIPFWWLCLSNPLLTNMICLSFFIWVKHTECYWYYYLFWEVYYPP